LAQIQERISAAELLRLTRSNPLDTVKVAAAIADAESAVNTYAIGTFGFPWAVVPAQATDATFAICHAYLYQRSWPGTPMPLHIKEPYDSAKRELVLLRDKKISWVETNAPEVANLSKAFVAMPNDEPVYDSPRQARLGKIRKIL